MHSVAVVQGSSFIIPYFRAHTMAATEPPLSAKLLTQEEWAELKNQPERIVAKVRKII